MQRRYILNGRKSNINHTNPKKWLLPEEFPKNATTTPNVDCRSIPLLTKQ
jgi:hypothetical protein